MSKITRYGLKSKKSNLDVFIDNHQDVPKIVD